MSEQTFSSAAEREAWFSGLSAFVEQNSAWLADFSAFVNEHRMSDGDIAELVRCCSTAISEILRSALAPSESPLAPTSELDLSLADRGLRPRFATPSEPLESGELPSLHLQTEERISVDVKPEERKDGRRYDRAHNYFLAAQR